MLPVSDSRTRFGLPQPDSGCCLLVAGCWLSAVCRLLEQLMQIVCLLPSHVGVRQSSSHLVVQASSQSVSYLATIDLLSLLTFRQTESDLACLPDSQSRLGSSDQGLGSALCSNTIYSIMQLQLLLICSVLSSAFPAYYLPYDQGERSEPSHHPYAKYVVSIQTKLPRSQYFGTNHFCVGTIVAPIYVLTASHCILDSK